jgi:hypothetical protein
MALKYTLDDVSYHGFTNLFQIPYHEGNIPKDATHLICVNDCGEKGFWWIDTNDPGWYDELNRYYRHIYGWTKPIPYLKFTPERK